ncbi:hypothetical protein SDC9_174598 [bioreactor metagenome]|uniref:Uncharacterized protein n=1 Tax=bioreactor metagenome TaxID=1076179 RepID=A0A645GJM9_9ZZZZ
MDDLVPVLFHARAKGDDHVLVIDWGAQAIDAGHAGHDDHVPALRQRRRGGVAQLVYLVIDGRVLCYIGIGGRHVGLRLVIIIVTDKIIH